jgi:hypothetical protein
VGVAGSGAATLLVWLPKLVAHVYEVPEMCTKKRFLMKPFVETFSQFEEYRLLLLLALVRTDVSEECLASIIKVTSRRTRNTVTSKCSRCSAGHALPVSSNTLVEPSECRAISLWYWYPIPTGFNHWPEL